MAPRVDERLNPDYVQAVRQTVNRAPYFDLLSMELSDLGLGRSLVAARVEEKHLQPYGLVHGGVYASLLDAATFWAVFTQLDEGRHGLTTVELKVNYLAPAASGELLAHGRSLKVGRTLCLGEARLEDGAGKLLAHGTATMMVLDTLAFHDASELPPKYLDP